MARKKTYWTVTEIIETFQVNEEFIRALEEDQIVCPTCRRSAPNKVFTPDEVEKLRLAKVLMEEMDVNLPGVEVVLHMRKNMIEMRRQFDKILEDLAQQIQESLESRS
jgi:MerR family transcriptional regulator/heat shock protein HspR